ncbi:MULTISPECIES: iron-siderophore ABC transporter substrate-binding protein [unclassified Streptomyces]|uniref:iron-siderophore ABC transporter substrate-binding protein n=1 Tax=unclassified Streptomyces TaxID=2593676 RepID=UPI000DB900F1|nr:MULTISPECIES: iron-siderophore ABC transporter substrate-binding protein [unclassified Streptomyces]MYT74500.1 ABC transporter substrate-binding protein [Streptomyces sp. SID8367]RAJ91480.1 iron complex transport system substrate-binding protein [Streptomyces sp. PsTaAH-137]
MALATPRRRSLLVGALALTLTGTLAACGSDTDGSSAAAGSASAGAFPAKVSTKFGTVTVKERPKRVVALGWGDAETALALGVQPVGQSDWLAFGGDGVGPWAKGKYDKSPQKIGTLEPEYEKIAALKPDLILDTKSSGDQTRYDTLSKIAPTIGVPEGGDQYKISWEKQTTMVSQALGLADRGEKLIDGTKKEFAAAAKAHPEFKDRTITVGSRTATTWGAYVRGTGRVDFVERLGFTNNPAVEKKAGSAFSVPVSEENLQMLDADLLVMAPIGTTAKKISSDPLYRAIPGVKKGHSLVFDDKNISSAFATDSVLSTRYALKHVVPLLAEKLK